MAAIYNRTEEKARATMAQYGVPRYYADWRAMIDQEKPDFMDIITPPETHEEICAYAASRGVHIICQKSLAPSFDASRTIVQNARTAGVRFMVHENWRWQPWHRKIKEIQQSGGIGEFTHAHFLMCMGDGWGEAYLDWQPFFRDYPRLLVYETVVHFIDTFRYLLGEVTEVFSDLRRLNPVIAVSRQGRCFPVRERSDGALGCQPLQRGEIAVAALHVRPTAARRDGRASNHGYRVEVPDEGIGAAGH